MTLKFQYFFIYEKEKLITYKELMMYSIFRLNDLEKKVST